MPTEIDLQLSDAFSLSDAQAYQRNYVIPISDSFVFTDSEVATMMNFVDQLVLTDWQTTDINKLTLTDSVSIQVLGFLTESLTDQLVLSDALNTLILGLYNFVINDTFAFADALVTKFLGVFAVQIGDFIVLADTISKSSPINFAFSDTLSFSDSIVEIAGSIQNYNIGVTESFTFTDQVTAATNLIGLFVLVQDQLLLRDSLQYAIPGAFDKILISDNFSFSDSIELVLLEAFNTYLRKYLNDYQPAPPDPSYFFQGATPPPNYFPGQSNVSAGTTITPALPPTTNISIGVGDSLVFQDSLGDQTTSSSLSAINIGMNDFFTFYDFISISGAPTMNLNFVVGEQPTVINNQCTLQHVPVLNSVGVFINGSRARIGIDYNISGSVITLLNWNSANTLIVDYEYVA